jgi:flagellar assembly protein FliH
MAILRSRAVTAEAVDIANPAVDQALGIWQRRVDQAREAGRQAGLAEASEMRSAAEAMRQQAQQSVKQAEQAAAKRIAAERARFVAETGHCLDSLYRLIGEQERLRGEILRAAEREVVELACALAARILRHEVRSDPAWIEDLLARALALAPDKRRVVLRLHPADAAQVVDLLPTVEQRAGLNGAVDLQADEHLARGACLLESGGTSIDAGLAGSWSRLREQLLLAAPGDRWQQGVEADAASAAALVERLAAETEVVADEPEAGDGAEPGP